MTLADDPVLAAIVATLALLVGYLVGSIPVSTFIARTAGIATATDGVDPGPAGVWALAGPGWGELAVTGALAKGVIPVAIGVVTWSWAVGWLAGLGAVIGACVPALGRRRVDRRAAAVDALVVGGGAAFALAPPAGAVAILGGLLVAGVARILGRRGRAAATAGVAAAVVGYPLLFVAVEPLPARLAAILVLYGVAGVRVATARR